MIDDPEDVSIICPCCHCYAEAASFHLAPSVIRGTIAGLLSEAGLSPIQISEVLGWPRSTVRSLLWYQRHVAKRKP